MNEVRRLWMTRAGRAALYGIGALALLTVVLLVALWPSEGRIKGSGLLTFGTERAKVTEVVERECPGFTICQTVTFRIESGPDEGAEQTLPAGGANLDPSYEVGDVLRVRALEETPADADPAVAGGEMIYAVVDFERRGSLLLIALVFAVAVLAVGGLRGGISLIGMLASLGIIVVFVVPAIAAGSDPVLVAVVGSSAIMLVTIPASHGLGAKAIAAVIGTTLAFGLAALLASAFFELAQITGLASEEASFIRAGDPEISIRGLALAGAVIAALGVLDDATVSQASVVVALRRTDPDLGSRPLFARAMVVGRDHVAATVNTLVLAYAGASLPLLLLFRVEGSAFGSVINSEVIATEIVATLVGSIAIVAAVPFTTAIAVVLARRLPSGALGGAGSHAH